MSGRKRTLKLGWRELWPVWVVFGILIAIGIVGMQVMFPPTMATIPTRQAARFFRTCSLTAAIEVGLVRPVVAEFQRSRVPVDVNAKRSLNTTHRFVFAAGAIEDSSALLFHRSFRLNHAVRSKQFDGRENMVCASYYDLTAASVAALRRSRWLAQVLLWIPIELLFALGATEVIRLPSVLGPSGGGSRFYIHAAHKIFHNGWAFHYNVSSVRPGPVPEGTVLCSLCNQVASPWRGRWRPGAPCLTANENAHPGAPSAFAIADSARTFTPWRPGQSAQNPANRLAKGSSSHKEVGTARALKERRPLYWTQILISTV